MTHNRMGRMKILSNIFFKEQSKSKSGVRIVGNSEEIRNWYVVNTNVEHYNCTKLFWAVHRGPYWRRTQNRKNISIWKLQLRQAEAHSSLWYITNLYQEAG
jgi:hypothetical protein